MKLIALPLLLAASTPALADMPWAGYTTTGLAETREPWQLNWDDASHEWLLISTDSQNQKWLIQLSSDLKAHKQPRSKRSVWLKLDFSENFKEKAAEAKMLMTINCDAETFSNDIVMFYYPDNSVEDVGPNPTQRIVPESMAATVAGRVCSQ